ncbi:uncharacterized protein LOC129593987 [Paramacrobiotus metropolitanus]|uniref:uncharacterized protein LOC129593987 n=1 Tax=Paramacrobiotus metropolitanus TaxID=2943436 RepID=UPI00244623FA|nr:uncharacterized protein LOC129593987 [Paramacrobiotus metropolitanus]
MFPQVLPWFLYLLVCWSVLSFGEFLEEFGASGHNLLGSLPYGASGKNISFTSPFPFLKDRISILHVTANGHHYQQPGSRPCMNGHLFNKGPEMGPLQSTSPSPLKLDLQWDEGFWDTECNDTNGTIRPATAFHYRFVTDMDSESPVREKIKVYIKTSDPAYQFFSPQWAFIFTFVRYRRGNTSSCHAVQGAEIEDGIQMTLTTDGRYSFAIATAFNNTKEDHRWTYDGSHAWLGFRSECWTTASPIQGGSSVFRLDGDSVTPLTCTISENRNLFVSPWYGSVLGGTKLKISGICLNQNQQNNSVYCRFGDRVVKAYRGELGSIQCVTPVLNYKGHWMFNVSVDGGVTYPYTGYHHQDWYTHPVKLVNRSTWMSQSGAAVIQLAWDPYQLSSNNDTNVSVDFIGWYMSHDSVHVMFLPLIPSAANSGKISISLSQINFGTLASSKLFLSGTFRIMKYTDRTLLVHQTEKEISAISLWSELSDMGVLEKLSTNLTSVSDNSSEPGVSHNGTLYTIHKIITAKYGREAERAIGVGDNTTLSMTVSRNFTANSEEQNDRLRLIYKIGKCSAAGDFCSCWKDAEQSVMQSVDPDNCGGEFNGCPPNIMQAFLSRGRFYVPSDSSACNRHNESSMLMWPAGDCVENPGASLCVTGFSRSWRYQQQCCYGQDGNLLPSPIHTSAGWTKLNNIFNWHTVEPDGTYYWNWIARQLEEVVVNQVPVRKCCALSGDWASNSCQMFRQQRRSSSSKCYVPPRPGGGFGDPHIQTYDGLKYTFNGLGEYVVVQVPGVITVQGRTSKVKTAQGSDLNATIWTGLVFATANVTVQLSFTADRRAPDLYIDNKLVEPHRIVNRSTQGDALITTERRPGFGLHKVSASLPSGILVEVEENEATLQFQILLPSDLQQGNTSGLLGRCNNDPTDDLYPRGAKNPVPHNSSTEHIFTAFGETWRVTAAETLFIYESPETYDTINDPNFRPVFDVTQTMNETFKQKVKEICGNNTECLFDVAATGNIRLGQATLKFAKDVEKEFKVSVSTGCQQPVIDETAMIASNVSFITGNSITLKCKNSNFVIASGSRTLTCKEDGSWSGETLHCREKANESTTAATTAATATTTKKSGAENLHTMHMEYFVPIVTIFFILFGQLHHLY